MDWLLKQWSAITFQFFKLKNNWIKKMNPIRLTLETMETEKYGDHYSFIYVPKNFIKSTSIVYSVGVGEDILSDLELIESTNCEIFLFDPTPRSKEHIEYVLHCIENNITAESEEGTRYITNSSMLDKLIFIPIALHTKDETVKFYLPKIKSAVSHSINNIQDTSDFIEVEAKRILSIFKMLDHKKVDFLKLDIEGSEFEVLENIIDDSVDIECIYVEYHYDKKIGMRKSINKIQQSINKVISAGYKPYYMKDDRYIGFIKS